MFSEEYLNKDNFEKDTHFYLSELYQLCHDEGNFSIESFGESKLRDLLGDPECKLNRVDIAVMVSLLTSSDPVINVSTLSLSPIISYRSLRRLYSMNYIKPMDSDFNTMRMDDWLFSDFGISEEFMDYVDKGSNNGNAKQFYTGNISSNKIESNNPKEAKVNKDGLTIWQSLKKTKLFYNDELTKSLKKIVNTLDIENFEKVRERLLEKNQHAGVLVSFYGETGTGKTEAVYQIAKDVKRDVFILDLGSTESAHYGEQCERICGMFNKYKNICEENRKDNKPVPIMLFNEADSIFTKRFKFTGTNDALHRENNAIVNMLLNELETFDGIMFITTNVIDNLDSAFERRFLFNIKFERPNKEIQQKIWKNKFPELSEEDISEISDKYNLTGGNINNISKKAEIEYILSGKNPDKKSVLEICQTEKIQNVESRKMGFQV